MYCSCGRRAGSNVMFNTVPPQHSTASSAAFRVKELHEALHLVRQGSSNELNIQNTDEDNTAARCRIVNGDCIIGSPSRISAGNTPVSAKQTPASTSRYHNAFLPPSIA